MVLLPLGLAARAEPIRAVYGVQAAGMQVMRIEAIYDLTSAGGYRIESSFRFTGIAGWFASGQQTGRAEGRWQGDAVRPLRFQGEGRWRGDLRQVVLDYPAGQPVLRLLTPPDDPDREQVPEAMRRDTIDSLSALAQLTRSLATTGRCDGRAAVFDGRRRADFQSVTAGQEVLQPWRNAWAGPATRCAFTARQLAGFRHEDGPDAREPQEGSAWMARPGPNYPIIPVRVDMPGRWLGRLTGYLLEVGPAGSSRASSAGNSLADAATGAPSAISGRP